MRNTLKKIIYYLLRVEAKIILWKYKPKIVAITGSVGKTSTKDALFAVLSRFAYVRKSEKSYNTQIGLPLTILGCPNGWNNLHVWFQNLLKGVNLILWKQKYPEWLILEVGVGKPDDMRTTASWLKTDAVIMTAIGDTPVHIEFFESRAELVAEKSKLINTLKKGGVLILNADDPTILQMKEKTKNRIFTYGFNTDSNLKASGLNIAYNSEGNISGLVFRVESNGSSLPVLIDGVFGKNHAYAAMAALSFAYAMNFNLVEAIGALRNYELPPGRMRFLAGINQTYIIDDSYNASPFAMITALETLGEVDTKGRKIAVLGDMLELGRHTKEEHEKIGLIVKNHAKLLVVVGPRAQDIKTSAIASGMKEKSVLEFGNSREAAEFLPTLLKSGDFILVKGSQGARMERIVEAILEDKNNKASLLVRQEPEWLAKE